MDVVDRGVSCFKFGDVSVVSTALLPEASHSSTCLHHRKLLSQYGPGQLDVREHLHGARLLDVPEDGRHRVFASWSNQEVKVLWHDHISQHIEVEPLACLTQGFQEDVSTNRIAEYRESAACRACQLMSMADLVDGNSPLLGHFLYDK